MSGADDEAYFDGHGWGDRAGSAADSRRAEFIARLTAAGRKFLVLTNNPAYTPRDLSARLTRLGIAVPATHIFTAALATAQFLHAQRPKAQLMSSVRQG